MVLVPTDHSAHRSASYVTTPCLGIRRQHSSERECERDYNNDLAHVKPFLRSQAFSRPKSRTFAKRNGSRTVRTEAALVQEIEVDTTIPRTHS